MGIFVKALRALLELCYQLVGDYGVSILLITILVRMLLLPLSFIQREQMRKQRKLQEKAEQIRKSYGKNQKRINEELQKLYEAESVGSIGCLVPFLQLPIMLILYRAILSVVTAETGTMLLPWIDSLLSRDKTWLLPVATLLIQVLPQLYSYIPYFESLQMPKQQFRVLLPIVLLNAAFVFALPSGVGLYYFVSGLFTATEQMTANFIEVRKLKCS